MKSEQGQRAPRGINLGCQRFLACWAQAPQFFISLSWTLFKVNHLRFVTLLKDNWENQQAATHAYYLLCQCLKAVKGNKLSLNSHPEWV